MTNIKIETYFEGFYCRKSYVKEGKFYFFAYFAMHKFAKETYEDLLATFHEYPDHVIFQIGDDALVIDDILVGLELNGHDVIFYFDVLKLRDSN